MRTVSKCLIMLSMCLGLSGVVYAQATPSAVKPSTATETAKPKPSAVKPSTATETAKPNAVTPKPSTETAKAKPAGSNVTKEKSAAVSGESATPAVKAPKHEHAARVTRKPAVEKSNKPESPDAKKLENTQAKEMKTDASKPESAKKQPESANKKPESANKQPESANKQPEHAAASTNVHKPMKHEASKPADQTEAAKPAK